MRVGGRLRAGQGVGLLHGASFGWLMLLFTLSGGMGLIDQVCFSKYLSGIFGATAYAVSAVLAAFMSGLMLGAHLGGRLARRVRAPLLAYGLAEMCAAVAIATAPRVFDALTPAYVSLATQFEGSLLVLTGLRWLVAALVVVLPTTALGMTLPLLAPALRAADSSADAGGDRSRLNALYACNTFGGACGALVAAYVLLPRLGLSATLYCAAATTLALGMVALVLGALRPVHVDPETNEPAAATALGNAHDWTQTKRRRLLALAAISGAVVFIAEVVGTHLLAVVVGNSAYAFALILAIFLVCLFVGAALAPKFERRVGPAALGTSLMASAITTLLVLPLWDLLPYVFGAFGGWVTSFAGRELVRAGVAFAVLALPTCWMGLTFPLLLRSVAMQRDVASWVGSLTVSNTFGAVAGSLLAGYVMLPVLGSEWTLRLVALVLGAAAFWLGPSEAKPRWSARDLRRPASLAFSGVVLLAVLLPRWNLERLTAGSNVYFDVYHPRGEVIFAREDVHGGITSVTEGGGIKTLLTNGKFQGNDGMEMHAQRFFAHYPSLFVEHFDRALVIGLGTGTTLGTFAGYPWQRVRVVEISPAIVTAARTHFTGPNRGALDDPRVELHVDDGRNHLLTHDDDYDLIGMELSSVWFAGAAALYSQDFYRLVSKRLKPKGIFQQWVQLHHMTQPVMASVLATLRSEFEHVALFYGGGQGVVVASHAPLRASRRRLTQLENLDSLREVLPRGRRLHSLTADALILGAGLDDFVEATATAAELDPRSLLSTDDNLLLEYATPRGNVLPWSTREAMVARLAEFRDLAALDALVEP